MEIHAIAGVLALYLLIGMAFAFLYGGIDHVSSTPFFADNVPATVSRCLYFSFTTLTTVGYGDMVADTDLGRTLAIFEALLGQIYLVTIVSLLVGNLGPLDPRRGRPRAGAADAAEPTRVRLPSGQGRAPWRIAAAAGRIAV